MSEAPRTRDAAPPALAPRRVRRILGALLMALGAMALLWSVLQLSSAGFGTRPTASFAQRRGYDQVKREVHEVFPEALLRALVGLALAGGGRLLLKSPGAGGPPSQVG